MTPRPTPRSPLLRTAGALPGAVLGAAAAVAGLVRRDKPLHPGGRLADGTLVVTDPDPAIPALAREGRSPCQARWSRAAGLPAPLPDVEGLALRVPGAGDDGGDADLLLASTGTRAWSRFLLLPRAPGRYGDLTTLLPVRAGGRPVVFRLSPLAGGTDDLPPATYALHVARGGGPWQRVGHLELAWTPGDTADRFDPVTHRLAGVEQYPLVTTLREPAYAAARAVTRARARADRSTHA